MVLTLINFCIYIFSAIICGILLYKIFDFFIDIISNKLK